MHATSPEVAKLRTCVFHHSYETILSNKVGKQVMMLKNFKEVQSKNFDGVNKKLKGHTIALLDFKLNYNQNDIIILRN